ncbi:ADP-ribosylglycohydrolase family protein [Pseudomonas sp.]|uniref:ADP-ribosylglycohydrolase family protein n=1 Tax=Pseudomonas sp. TaxID=306 RepID=UPI0026196DA9|nr:ADP-ribosylglycohydrolase family protein [Pseudomonas sp.]
MTAIDRALGTLHGLALGDALGMPTQSFSRAQVLSRFGHVTTLLDAPADQPVAPGMHSGSTTDDTAQALLIAQLLIEGSGHINPDHLAQRLIAWELKMKAKGSKDLLGPSTKHAIERIQAGHTPDDSGRHGTTNGAAMRIAPVGIAINITQAERFLDTVIQACQVTHNTSLGIASAAAIAAVVSSGINGETLEHALNAGTKMAFMAEPHGHWVAGGRIGPRIRWARKESLKCSTGNIGDWLYDVIGTSVASQESVVAAFALAQQVASGKLGSFDALCMAASLGGDTDTIAAMLGAMLGACGTMPNWPVALVNHVIQVNALHLEPLALSLLTLRNT